MRELIAKLSNDNFDAEITSSRGPVVLDVWAPWCAPCLAMAPTLHALARQSQRWLRVAKLDIEACPTLGKLLQVRAVPTLIVFLDGVELSRKIGSLSLRELAQWLAALGIGADQNLPTVADEPGLAWGAFYGDEALREFFLKRLLDLANAGKVSDQGPPGFYRDRQGSVAQMLVQHADPQVFERLTGMPYSMATVLNFVGPTRAVDIERIFSVLKAGIDLHQVPLQLIRSWVSDPQLPWAALLATPAHEQVRLDWLALAAEQLATAAVEAPRWAALRAQAEALHCGQDEPLSLGQDVLLSCMAALSPPPLDHEQPQWNRVLGAMSSAQHMLLRFQLGWTHEDLGMEIVVHQWFSRRAALEPDGQYTPERLAQEHRVLASEFPAWQAKYDDYLQNHEAHGQAPKARLTDQLMSLLAAAPRVA